MNKTAIKNFAIWARNKLIADICYRAGLMGITEKGIADPLPQSTMDAQFYDIGAAEPYLVAGEAIKQRRQLVSAIREKEADTDYATAYQYIMEEVAYTWFNRLIAVRFMEVNDYLPSHLRVLSSESGKVEPDLVTTPFDAELSFTAEEEAQIIQWKQDNKLDELFRFLFIKQCNALNEILPGLFEKTTDYTEVLLNLSVVDQEGVVYKLTHDIPEKDFNIKQGGQVEIIGWLYQYYNTEPKAAAFAKNGKITKEEIPAVTQLFTPDWIVRYMVENSLGRLWVEGHPDSDLRKNWKYYLDEAPQEPEVQAKLATIRKEYAALSPEDLTLIDPCMGSGHILVYAFDVLMQIYESVGYSQRDAAKSILEHNLYGLDIDDRAYQLAYFAVMMKARQYNRRILNGENTCHVYAIQESNPINRAHLKFFGAGLSDLEKNTAKMQLDGLLDILTDAKEYGSILNVPEYNWALLRRFVGGIDDEVQISLESAGVEQTAEELQKLIDLGETMARKYWVTCTNPPYAGTSNLSANVNNFVKKYYPDSKADLFAVFIERCRAMTADNGYQAMITQHSWMFLSSFEKLREKMMLTETVNMAHLGARAFEEIGGEVVQTTAFVRCANHVEGYKGTYCRLIEPTSQQGKEEMFLAGQNRYTANQDDFAKIPGMPVAYWVSERIFALFSGKSLGEYYDVKAGMCTGENATFILCWPEVDYTLTNICSPTKYMYTAHNKGGEYHKWYGNRELVLKYNDNALKLMESNAGFRHDGKEYYFKEHIGWSKITSGKSSFRYFENGFTFDSAGLGLFPKKKQDMFLTLAFLNSKVAEELIALLNPTLNVTPMVVKKLPFTDLIVAEKAAPLTEDNIELCKEDWDSYETSWDFTTHPLVYWSKGLWEQTNVACMMEHYYGYLPEASCPLEVCYLMWQGQCKERFEKLKANEEELNRIFIDIYGLQDELTPEVEEKDVTVRKADLQRDIKSLLSYAVGCMFGRYSIYKDGLLFAGEPYSLQAFVDKLNDRPGTVSAEELERAYRNEGVVVDEMFFPDEDNVIPITDEEYLDDDIVARLCDWLKAVYGAATLEENLNFIAKALGNKGSTSREVIRNYFVNDFFKDHCQTYSVTGSGKRPIYWLFDSGKQNGFKALVYLHRYTPDTIGALRVDYLHKMQRVYESEINRMQDMMDHTTNAREAAAASKRKDKLTKQLKECRDYDEKISHLALSRIALDLDDGVKVNYRKLQTAADGKFYEVLADSKNIMVKEKK
ncbi:restriction endonuclease [Faecalibacterium prausnitzii]|uniref:site-specific DNA-methyltransferase (adenine-specific) n=2 Tax=Faecalibacterium prausnitzii TaxID=853 RepID=A0A367G8U0_9FIRM|nr:BREX-1 system adenine-specific DNA-methyltransferase PglX [Faecalibacterium prausnitzii]MDU8563185.1 BREX-1 system adenine-specific DNA-methyltransferase PglX [Faecalibacterium prausnitzii]RCH47086.1 restriction endonuclease [Faecalibacterium prausnitzii]RCH50900.1 restriction endonuclease [Faecalibacterium prausnitzii]